MERTVRRLPVTHYPGNSKRLTYKSTGATARCSAARSARSTPLDTLPSRLHRPRSVCCRVKGAKAGEQELAENPSEYFEPFLRSLLLGVGAGIVCEALHVLFEFNALVREVRLDQLAQAWPSVQGQFAPVVVDDHLVALACWLLFYGIEAYAVMRVLEKHNKNPAAAARSLRTLTTLPRILLPRLTLIKSALRMPAVIWQWTAALAYVGVAASPNHQEKLAKSASRSQQQRPIAAPPLSDPDQEPEGPVDAPQVPPLKGLLIPQQLGGKGRTADRQEGDVSRRPGEINFPLPAIERRREQLRDARCFLKNFWYAAGFSRDLKDAPLAVDLLGETVVLYRDSRGSVVCLSNYCPHKGAPLSDGTICDIDGHDCIVCPYHGWAFDAQGRLRTLPSDEAAYERSSKPHVHGYPVVEKGGFIWLFFGSTDLPADERPPVPYVPELDDSAWRPVYGEIRFQCNHSAVFENAIDMAHIHYLHADSFGNQEMPQIRGMECETNAYGVDATFVLHNKPANPMWTFSEVPEVNVTAKALLPSTSVIGFTLARGLSFITFVSTVPISANESINRFALIRRLGTNPILAALFNWGVWDFLAVKAMLKILSQDKVMVEKLRPEMLLREVSAKADLPQLAFRKLRQQYIDMGYGVRATSVLKSEDGSCQ